MEAELVRWLAFAIMLAGMGSPAMAEAEPPGDAVRIVLKFVKRGSPTAPVARFDPASCPACAAIATPLFNAENARETAIALDVPRQRSLELAFDAPKDAVRRVVLESSDVPFRREGRRIIVQLAPFAIDAITATEVSTHVVEPGMVLRLEHADQKRRAGTYGTGPFPDVQRRAANVLEFALRDVVRQLALGEQAQRDRLGTIQIMGFDTNAPHGHVDAPPHIHMHLRWPGDTGTQIAHYYLTPGGLLSHNIVGVKGLAMPDRRFDPGETFTTIGPDGRGLYAHRITSEGWLEVGRPGMPACTIRPIDPAGFASGAIVSCPERPARRITATDDILAGIVRVVTDTITEIFRYDPDTGALLSPSVAPKPSPSVPAAVQDIQR